MYNLKLNIISESFLPLINEENIDYFDEIPDILDKLE